jgi:hypothetical protein
MGQKEKIRTPRQSKIFISESNKDIVYKRYFLIEFSSIHVLLAQQILALQLYTSSS